MHQHHSIWQPNHTGTIPFPFLYTQCRLTYLRNSGGTVWHTIPWNKWLPHISLHRRDRKWSGIIFHHRRGRKRSASLLQRKKEERWWKMSSRASSAVCSSQRISSRQSPEHSKRSHKIFFWKYPSFFHTVSFRNIVGETGYCCGTAKILLFLINLL